MEAVTAGIKLVLNCVGFVSPDGAMRLPGNLLPRTIVDQWQKVWTDFKEFTWSAAHGSVIHALAVLRSHYPSVKPKVIMTSYARGMSAAKIMKLEDEAEEAAVKLASDIDLFGKRPENAR